MKKLLAFGLLLAAVAARASVYEVPIAGTFVATLDPDVFAAYCDPGFDSCVKVMGFSGVMDVTTPTLQNGTVYSGISVHYDLPWSGVEGIQGFTASSDFGYTSATFLDGKLVDLVVSATNQWLDIGNGSIYFNAQISHARGEADGIYSLDEPVAPLAVPEPLSLSLMGLGTALVLLRRHRKDAGAAMV